MRIRIGGLMRIKMTQGPPSPYGPGYRVTAYYRDREGIEWVEGHTDTYYTAARVYLKSRAETMVPVDA